MRILYLDCFSGISGDMTVAALVDAGADRSYIEEELARIKLEPYTIEWKRIVKRGVSSLKFDVLTDPDHPPAHHRHYSEIVRIIQGAGFNEHVTKLGLTIFEKIAIAEAKIHDIPVEHIHFHEVGAIDSIVDIVAVALAIDSLQIDKIYASPVPLGSGTIHIDHGVYPIPAPATLEMMRGVPIASTNYRLELTTPTGAGIISGIVDEFSKSIPSMIVEFIGYGAGTRELPSQPNVLRAVIGKDDPFIGKWQITHEHLADVHDHPVDVHEHRHDDHKGHKHHSHHDHHEHNDHHNHHEHNKHYSHADQPRPVRPTSIAKAKFSVRHFHEHTHNHSSDKHDHFSPAGERH